MERRGIDQFVSYPLGSGVHMEGRRIDQFGLYPLGSIIRSKITQIQPVCIQNFSVKNSEAI